MVRRATARQVGRRNRVRHHQEGKRGPKIALDEIISGNLERKAILQPSTSLRTESGAWSQAI